MSVSSDSHETCSTCDGCLTLDHARSASKLSVLSLRDALPQAWLAARGLDASVKQEERTDLPSLNSSNRWLFYRLLPHAGVVSHAPGANIRTAFHGTWWYALWGLLRSGRVLESNDESKGHAFWHPGAERERDRDGLRDSEIWEGEAMKR